MSEVSTHRRVAVDQGYFWRPLGTCPTGIKVQLLTDGGVAVYGLYSTRSEGFVAWAPLPNVPKWLQSSVSLPPVDNVIPQEDDKSPSWPVTFVIANSILFAITLVALWLAMR